MLTKINIELSIRVLSDVKSNAVRIVWAEAWSIDVPHSITHNGHCWTQKQTQLLSERRNIAPNLCFPYKRVAEWSFIAFLKRRKGGS